MTKDVSTIILYPIEIRVLDLGFDNNSEILEIVYEKRNILPQAQAEKHLGQPCEAFYQTVFLLYFSCSSFPTTIKFYF